MDEYLFSEQMKECKSILETTHYLQMLNYSDPSIDESELHSLSQEDLSNFLLRKGVFSPPTLKSGVTFADGFRLVLHLNASDPKTFSPQVISFTPESYNLVIKELGLPFRTIETSSVVGPFFWWGFDPGLPAPRLQFVFRKSDVQQKGTSRGFEMTLSHSFTERMTSGYAKGTSSAKLDIIIAQLRACSTPVSHPILLPVLVLNRELSSENDQKQRAAREKVRELENQLTGRYTMDAATGHAPYEDLRLDTINRELAECQCQVMWKRPQAWRNVVKGVEEAAACFWDNLPIEQKTPSLQCLHRSILSRLDFIKVKLEGLDNYAHVSLERLNLQRDVMKSIIEQKDSRLNLLIATSSRRDSLSMKTLTFLGSAFLPGTLLSSIFSMSFFDFSGGESCFQVLNATNLIVILYGNVYTYQKSADINGSVSARLWIYFTITVPLTVVIMGILWKVDERGVKKVNEDIYQAETHMDTIENHILDRIRRRTGARVRTGDLNPA